MTSTTPTIGFHQWESGGVGAQGRAYSVWDNIKYGVEAFGDAALGMKPGHEIRAWQASNRAGFSRLMDSYHSWQAQNRANYPNAYHVARAMAQGAAPAAAISGAFMTLVGTGMLVMESGGALSSVAADLLGSTLEGTVGAFSVGGSASILGLSAAAGVGAGDLALRGFANAGDASVSLSGVGASRMGMFSGSAGVAEIVPGTGLPARSLSNVEAREWYHKQLADIPNRIDKTLSLRKQGLQAFKMRNEIKLQARELMSDIDAAAELPPPETLKQIVSKNYLSNQVGDDLWSNVIGSSKRTNRAVDDILGIHNPYNEGGYNL